MSTTPVTINLDTVSLNGVGDLSAAIRNGTSDIAIKTAEAIDTLETGLANVNTALAGVTASVPTPVIPPAASVVDFTPPTGTTTTITPSAPSSIGQFLIYFIQGNGITALFIWGANVRFGQTGFDSTMGNWNVFMFVSRIDPADSVLKWFQCALPLLGQF